MRKSSMVCFCLGMFATGCMFDAADVPMDEPAATMQALAPCVSGPEDSFQLATRDGCGRADFVSFGPGAPGGGNNDDYIVIHDFCKDGHGVKVWAWVDGVSVNHDVGAYNGNGLVGDPVIWDPFKAEDGTDLGVTQCLGIKVCLVDGARDSSGASCREATRYMNQG